MAILYTLFQFCILLIVSDASQINSQFRRWTNLAKLIQDPKVYSRSPFVMYGRGYQTVLSGFNRVNPQMWIDIRTWKDGKWAWSARAVMDPPDAYAAITQPPAFVDAEEVVLYDGSLYGYWLSGAGTYETGVIFAAGAPEDPIFYPDADTRLNFSGSVYMYRGEYSQWTNTQKLLPDTVVEQQFFGDSISICPKIPTNMAIGAHGDYDTGIYQAGAAYYFQATPTGRFWTQKQKLVPRDRAEVDWFGYRVVLYDEFLFVSSQFDDDNGHDAGAIYVFRQERAFGLNIWSQQQKIVSSGVSLAYGEFVSVHQHTMVLGSNFEDEQGGQTKTGAVYVYKTYKTPELPFVMGPSYHDNEVSVRDGEKPKPKPVPMFKWWSEQQKLLARDWHIFRYFGTYTTVYGDGKLLATGAFGEAFNDPIWEFAPFEPTGDNYRSGSAYIFVKDDKQDRWTQQQKFISPAPHKGEYFSDPYLHGSDLIIRNTKYGYIYSDNMNWNCLMVSVSDHFGDGWDKAYLMAHAPGSNTKLTDQYTPFCDSANPLVFRYCPLMMEDEGIYFFKMSGDYKTHKYWGEIRYEILNEADGKKYYGDHETSIGFDWDMETLSFKHVLSKNDKLFDNFKCESCPKPPPKPTPKASPKDADMEESRSLKGKYSTSSPTISPAPTLSQTVQLDYSVVTAMTTSLNGWHGYGTKNGTGAFWEIYNGNHNSRGQKYAKHGTELLYRGTICGVGIPMVACDLQLPDGDYVFRVGGALDSEKGDHTWEFCGRSGGMQEMLTFSVVNRVCIPYSTYTAVSYCEDVMEVKVVEGVIQLSGLPSTDLSPYDFEALGNALKHILSPASVKHIEASHDLEDSTDLGYIVKFKAYVSTASLGLTDGDDSLEVFDILASQLQSASDSGHLTEEVAASSEEMILGNHGLMKVSEVKLLSFVNGGETLFDSSNPQMNPLVTNIISKSDNSVEDSREDITVVDKFVSVEAEFGYVMMALVGLVVVGVGWRVAIRKDIHTRVPIQPYSAEASEHGESDTSSLLRTSPVDAQSSNPMDRLRHMGPALKEMADFEDEALGKFRENMDTM